MDDVAISAYCVGYYWDITYTGDGPYSDSRFTYPRSPAVVYRPTIPNPALTFNVVCPADTGSNNINVGRVAMYGVSLVPRCTCVEENNFESLQSQPLNKAFNGNFADYDLQQENPVSGWVSKESWKDLVIPVQYSGPVPADDNSNKGSVLVPYLECYTMPQILTISQGPTWPFPSHLQVDIQSHSLRSI